MVYNARKQELVVNGHRAAAPLRDGKQRLIVYCDRTGLEIFACNSLACMPRSPNSRFMSSSRFGSEPLVGRRQPMGVLRALGPMKRLFRKNRTPAGSHRKTLAPGLPVLLVLPEMDFPISARRQ
jgi:hypothetical protein